MLGLVIVYSAYVSKYNKHDAGVNPFFLFLLSNGIRLPRQQQQRQRQRRIDTTSSQTDQTHQIFRRSEQK